MRILSHFTKNHVARTSATKTTNLSLLIALLAFDVTGLVADVLAITGFTGAHIIARIAVTDEYAQLKNVAGLTLGMMWNLLLVFVVDAPHA